MAGTVMDGQSGQAIANAVVRLYHHETHTIPSGCFALGGADALPFEFGVSAPGYKTVVIKAVPGTYQALVTLVPEDSLGESAVKADKISREQYAELALGCR